MSLITRMRKQKAVYWAQDCDVNGVARTDTYGQPKYLAPVEIACRWEDKQEQITDKEGHVVAGTATVYVDRDMVPGDLLWLGLLKDAVNNELQRGSPGVSEIVNWQSIPNFRATESLRIAKV